MNLIPVLRALVLIGFLQTDAEVYLHLVVGGPQNAASIAKALNLPIRQVQSSLKYLMRKQAVSSLQVYPISYSAMPMEEVLERFKQISLEDALSIEKKKQDAAVIWRSIAADRNEHEKQQ